jgi:hypothetical protein
MCIKIAHATVQTQIQTPEDGHIGPKHVVLSESERKIIICCITDKIIDGLVCHATGCLNTEL